MTKTAFQVFRSVLVGYIITGIILVVLSTLLYHFDMSEKIISAGVVVAYLLSGLAAGFLIGKSKREKKYLWGAVVGLVYFIVLALVSLVVYGKIQGELGDFFTTMVLCIGSSILGGMLS